MRKMIAMLIGVTMLAMATLASAQVPTYPDKPIRIVVPFPVGGIADTFGREDERLAESSPKRGASRS
jgi:tripartite-type tricarboxylate transporter receptor subunit TctC